MRQYREDVRYRLLRLKLELPDMDTEMRVW
jgi:hypothetical protein